MASPPAEVLAFEALSRLGGLRHAVTTRAGGVSDGPYASLNLSLRTGDAVERVLENRRRAAAAAGAEAARLTVPAQCHGAGIACVTAADAGRGARSGGEALPDADGAATAERGVPLMALSADCLLVLLYDPERRALAVTHAGWRGVLAKILPGAVRVLGKRFGVEPASLWAGLSPAIGPCCFEVGPEVLARCERDLPYALDFIERGEGRTRLNLWDLAWHQLVAAGLRADQIEVLRQCTRCRADRFYSHRRDGPATGRFGLIAMLD